MNFFLGIEGGGTRTTAIVSKDGVSAANRSEFGPTNIRIMTDAELRGRLEAIASWCPNPASIGMGLAGARTETDRERVRQMARAVWPEASCTVTHDLEIALLAAGADPNRARVLVLSGTGSCCYGQDRQGRESKVGGWGHLLGDLGSGYAIGLAALRRAVFDLDRHGRWEALGSEILRQTMVNNPDELIGWAIQASKAEIAGAALAAFAAAQNGDPAAREVLSEAARDLARDALLCAKSLAGARGAASFILAGGVLLKQPGFGAMVARLIEQGRPGSQVCPLEREGAWGAVLLAARNGQSRHSPKSEAKPPVYVPEFEPGASPTEQRNPRSMNFDRLSIGAAIELMLGEEAGVAPAVLREKRALAKAVGFASKALKAGGRIFYAGAGTSGRLGVLDASECPPTFRAPPEMVQGIMAGGARALVQAVEGAEDDARAGAESVRFRGLGPKDVLVGIAASGRTPFVWGALAAARQAGARTVLLHFNPSLKIDRAHRPDALIAPNLGPEVLTGSTRLKCGTATKLVLNLISTIAMARLGKVAGNLMVDLNPSNVKLRDRAIRIVQELSGCDPAAARAALERNGWVVKAAWRSLAARARKER